MRPAPDRGVPEAARSGGQADDHDFRRHLKRQILRMGGLSSGQTRIHSLEQLFGAGDDPHRHYSVHPAQTTSHPGRGRGVPEKAAPSIMGLRSERSPYIIAIGWRPTPRDRNLKPDAGAAGSAERGPPKPSRFFVSICTADRAKRSFREISADGRMFSSWAEISAFTSAARDAPGTSSRISRP
jgi:hypothetical protein